MNNNFIDTDNKEELKKAVLTHLLNNDYDRINQIREDYPAGEMLYLLGLTATIVNIDLTELFKE